MCGGGAREWNDRGLVAFGMEKKGEDACHYSLPLDDAKGAPDHPTCLLASPPVPLPPIALYLP